MILSAAQRNSSAFFVFHVRFSKLKTRTSSFHSNVVLNIMSFWKIQWKWGVTQDLWLSLHILVSVVSPSINVFHIIFPLFYLLISVHFMFNKLTSTSRRNFKTERKYSVSSPLPFLFFVPSALLPCMKSAVFHSSLYRSCEGVYSTVALFSSFLLSVYTRRHIIFIHLCAVILLRNNSKIMIV